MHRPSWKNLHGAVGSFFESTAGSCEKRHDRPALHRPFWKKMHGAAMRLRIYSVFHHGRCCVCRVLCFARALMCTLSGVIDGVIDMPRDCAAGQRDAGAA